MEQLDDDVYAVDNKQWNKWMMMMIATAEESLCMTHATEGAIQNYNQVSSSLQVSLYVCHVCHRERSCMKSSA